MKTGAGRCVKQAVSPVSERILGSMAEEYYRTGDRDFILGHMQEALARLKAG